MATRLGPLGGDGAVVLLEGIMRLAVWDVCQAVWD